MKQAKKKVKPSEAPLLSVESGNLERGKLKTEDYSFEKEYMRSHFG